MADHKNKSADIVAVAKAAKVSISTVSRSFNHPGLVKPATRKRIDAAVRRLGYIRNRAAQTIHGIRSGTIGMIVPTIDHAIFAELIQSFSDAIDARGFSLLLASHSYDLDREYALARKMLEHRVDGLALIGMQHADETFALIDQQDTPSVLLWNHEADSKLPCVGADNALAGRMIADHLLDLGHRRIATLFPPLGGNDRAEQRFHGVIQGLQDRGIDVPDHLRWRSPYSVAAAKAEVLSQLHAARPSAIICGNDVLASGAVFAAKNAGLNVPGDISVAGIGDFKGSRDFEPALTTVRIPARQIGELAAEMIVRSITEPGEQVTSTLIRPELSARDSCAHLSGETKTPGP